MLELQALHAGYGQGQVLRGIDLRVAAGEVVSLLGRNGAGKSTTLRCVMGLVAPTSGTTRFDGTVISGRRTEDIARLGLGYIPEDRRIFAGLTVEENLRMGLYASGPLPAAESKDRISELLAWFPRLKERRQQDGRTLSGGEQQMLAIARGLAAHPRLLLIDEPSEGLAPMVVDEIFGSIRRMKQRGIAVLLVEQNVRRALAVSDRACFVERGRITATGDAQQWLLDDEMRRLLAV